MSTNLIKILLYYHKPAYLFKSDSFIPFHCGRVLGNIPKNCDLMTDNDYEWLLEHCMGDDSGDNISCENGRYCELTGHYWAWKNYEKLGNPEYIGFMQYRRLLILSDKAQGDSRIFKPFLTSAEYADYLNVEYLHLGEYDMYVPKALPICKFKVGKGRYEWTSHPPEICKVSEQHPGGIGQKEVLEYIQNVYPKYYETALDYFESMQGFQWNMFIAKRGVFFEYARFLFDVLGYVDHKINYKYFSSADLRYIAYLGEFLTAIFISQKIKEQRKIKQLSMVHIVDTTEFSELRPIFRHNVVNLCCIADNDTSYICGVMLQSVITHSSESVNYEIVVLYWYLSDKKIEQLRSLTQGRENIVIRFYRVNRLFYKFMDYDKPSARAIIPTCIPVVFGHYEKVIYLEHDTVVRTDIYNLYSENHDSTCIAACKDLTVIASLNAGREKLTYYRDILGIKNPYEQYISDAVVLYNISAIHECGIEDECLKLVEKESYKRPAQDALNKVFNGRITFLNSMWNVCPQWSVSQFLPARDYLQWQNSKEKCYVLSYRGTVSKPWNNTRLDFAADWWKYARNTSFYEELLSIESSANSKKELDKEIGSVTGDITDIKRRVNMLQSIITKIEEGRGGELKKAESEKKKLQRVMKEIAQLEDYRRKLRRVRWRTHFSWGKRRQRYLARKKQLKDKIFLIEKFIKAK